MSAQPLELRTAPFAHAGPSTRRLMFEVIAALVPVVLASVWFFGVGALLVVLATTAGAVGAEWLLGDRKGLGTLKDGSALLTGLLTGLTLPPAIPLWMALLGGFVAIGLGKRVLGGLGGNFFNPALVGRAFLQAAFPVPITTWTPPGQGLWHVPTSAFTLPFGHAEVDFVTAASPLGLAKFDHKLTDVALLFSGNTAGSLGETCGALIIASGVWLGVRRVFDWRLPVAMVGAVAVFAAILHAVRPEWPPAWFMVGSGGLLFGAVFMATDPVTTPVTPKGMWIFGIGAGILVVLIRVFGGLPEGVMYAIMIMNAVTPLINGWTQPKRFGG